MTFLDWIPLLILTSASIALSRHYLPDWAIMFVLSFSIYFGFKWLTYKRALAKGTSGEFKISLGYIFAWVGMDAVSFLNTKSRVPKPERKEWVSALLKTFLGGMILWLLPKQFYPQHILVAGYIGLAGLIIMVFFGFFHLISLVWRENGLNARPLMNSPLLASSLSDFWSNRWNLAFRDLDRVFIFRPAVRRAGFTIATIAAFLFSGLLHDLAISLPAEAGYGLPTLYFLMQAGGVLIQKSGLGNGAGLNGGFKGWLFALVFVLFPAVLLFHPPAVENIVVPFMKVVRAI